VWTGAVHYEIDNGCDTIRSFTGDGATPGLSLYAGTTHGYGNDDFPPAPDLTHIKLKGPTSGVYLNGALYVIEQDGTRIRKITSTGSSVLAGSSAFLTGAGGDVVTYGSSTASRYHQMMYPTTPVTDGKHVWLVDDVAHDLVQVSLVDGSSMKLTTLPFSPTGLSRIGMTLYIAGNSNLYTWDLSAGSPTLVTYVTGGVTGNYLTSDGTNFYWFDTQVVKKMDAAKTITAVAGVSGSNAVMDGTGAGATFTSTVQSLISDGGTYLYALDAAKNIGRLVVRRINVATGEVKTIVGQVGVAGMAEGTGTSATLAGAYSLGTDGKSLFIGDGGELFTVGDLNGPTIRQMDLSTGLVTTMVGKRGQWSAISGQGKNAVIDYPTHMAVDAATHTIVLFDNVEGVFEVIR